MDFQVREGKCYQIDIEDLGEFRFLVYDNVEKINNQKYYFESYWSPEKYGILDFIIGSSFDNFEEDVIDNIDYYIDGARISCEIHVQENTDTEDVYRDILKSYFNYTSRDLREIIERGNE
jgi:hypothetical protein